MNVLKRVIFKLGGLNRNTNCLLIVLNRLTQLWREHDNSQLEPVLLYCFRIKLLSCFVKAQMWEVNKLPVQLTLGGCTIVP